VTQSWVTASGKSGAFVPALDHLLLDTAAERKFGFSLATAYQAAQRCPLLTGITVFLAPGATPCCVFKRGAVHVSFSTVAATTERNKCGESADFTMGGPCVIKGNEHTSWGIRPQRET